MAELGNLDLARFGASFQAFMDAVRAVAAAPESPLLERIKAFIDEDIARLPVITEAYEVFDRPNLQVALDDYLAAPDVSYSLIGIAGEVRHFGNAGLSMFLTVSRQPLQEGPVDYVNVHLAGDRVLPCVNFGLYFIERKGQRLIVLVMGPNDQGPRQKLSVEVLATEPQHAQAFLATLSESMRRLNVYRGHIISLSAGDFGFGGQRSSIAFHTLPRVSRTDVILPEGLMERIERHTIRFAERASELLAAGRSLKRGLLLYGPPGVGKTLTIEYLAASMPGRTVVLTTGLGLGLLQPIMQLTRSLTPAMVVLEDIDLIAEERGMPFGHAGPLLFQLLNEMDGLQNDADVIFVLTTNRPEVLEPALAARPGRIDLAIELPLPNRAARRRLLDLYARGLTLEGVDLDSVAEGIEGATPAYIKELLRKAAVIAAIEGTGHVTEEHMTTALAELQEGGRLAQRLLGFRTAEDEQQGPGGPLGAGRSPWPTGFPPQGAVRRAVLREEG